MPIKIQKYDDYSKKQHNGSYHEYINQLCHPMKHNFHHADKKLQTFYQYSTEQPEIDDNPYQQTDKYKQSNLTPVDVIQQFKNKQGPDNPEYEVQHIVGITRSP